MKVLITGATGLLGRQIHEAAVLAGHDVTGLGWTRSSPPLVKVDLQDRVALDALISSIRPDVLIHSAAERRPDVAEADPDAVQSLNVDVTQYISELSITHGFSLIYISTDYVFDGKNTPEIGYQPSDAVGPTNLYGVTKEAGERVVLAGLAGGGKGMILRVPVLYGDVQYNAESAINVLLDITKSAAASPQKEFKMDHWASRYPTNVALVARVLLALVEKSQTTPLPKILHFSSQEVFTKYEICQLLARLHSPPLHNSNMKAVVDRPKAGETVRPKDCHLSNLEIEKFGIDTSGGIGFEDWWKSWLSTH